jgi:hypothetical protein
MASRDRREKRVSTARRRAEQHVAGFETTTLKVPDGLGFYDLSPGIHRLSIIPFKAGKGNPFADPGVLHYERTFYIYRKIGIEENSYVCPSKTFGKPDPIQEIRQKMAKDPKADPEEVKALNPKERQIFLVYGGKRNEEVKLALLENSYHTFGKLLDSRIKNSDEDLGWDLFYFPDEDGLTLELTVEEDGSGAYKFNKVTAIDFLPRKKALPDEVVNHGYCLDDFLVEVGYDHLKNIYMGVHNDEEEGDDDEPPARSKTKAKAKPADDDDDDAPPVRSKRKAKPADDEWGDDDDDDAPPARSKTKAKAKPAVDDDDDDDDAPPPVRSKSKAKPAADEEEEDDDDDDSPPAKPKPSSKSKAPAFARGDEVIYKRKVCTISKISPDGTSLTLLDEDGEQIRAVDPADCKPTTTDAADDDDEDAPPPAKSKSKSATKAKTKPADDDDDEEWDGDWPDED